MAFPPKKPAFPPADDFSLEADGPNKDEAEGSNQSPDPDMASENQEVTSPEASDPSLAQGNQPNLFDLYGADLDAMASLYENPVVDNPAEIPKDADPYDFYDPTDGSPLTGRAAPAEDAGRNQKKSEMKDMLALRAQERHQASTAFQSNVAKLNKQNKGSY